MMSSQSHDAEFDVLVIGTGASGMATAVTAASQGLKVLVVEKGALYGGTTARWSDQDGRWRGWCLADKLQGGGLSEPCRLSTHSGACHRQWFDPSASR